MPPKSKPVFSSESSEDNESSSDSGSLSDGKKYMLHAILSNSFERI
jgi:hypothetical protein